MRICFPVEQNNGLKSEIYGHFGSAPMFVIVNTDDNSVALINNGNLGHEHGNCSPILALQGQKIDSLILHGIGAGAVNKLRAMGVEVYQAQKQNIEDNLLLFKADALQKMSSTCAGHSHGGGCGH